MKAGEWSMGPPEDRSLEMPRKREGTKRGRFLDVSGVSDSLNEYATRENAKPNPSSRVVGVPSPDSTGIE